LNYTNFQAVTSTSTGGVQCSSDNGGKPSVVLNASIATKWEGWVCVSINLQWARQNLISVFVDFATAAPQTTKPAPNPWSPRPCESTNTLTSVEIDFFTKTSQFGTFFIFSLLKTPHGYDIRAKVLFPYPSQFLMVVLLLLAGCYRKNKIQAILTQS